MSFFGDLAKAAKKGFKKFKKLGGEVVKATRPIRPAFGAIPVVGGAIRTGLDVADPLVVEQEKKRKKAGRPARRPGPGIATLGRTFLSRALTSASRQATGRLEPPVRTRLVPRAPTPAFPRPVPGGIQAATAAPPRRAPIMPLVPVRGPIRAQPALQFQVPRALGQSPFQTLKEQLPFQFGGEAAGAQPLQPLSPSVDKLGRPLVVAPSAETRVRCPPGYLAITMPDGSRACALAGVAIAAGLARRRRKPLISVKETRAMQVADRARGKLKRVTTKAGFTVREKRTVRRRSS